MKRARQALALLARLVLCRLLDADELRNTGYSSVFKQFGAALGCCNPPIVLNPNLGWASGEPPSVLVTRAGIIYLCGKDH